MFEDCLAGSRDVQTLVDISKSHALKTARKGYKFHALLEALAKSQAETTARQVSVFQAPVQVMNCVMQTKMQSHNIPYTKSQAFEIAEIVACSRLQLK